MLHLDVRHRLRLSHPGTLEDPVRFHQAEVDELIGDVGREVRAAEHLAGRRVLDVGRRVAEADEHIARFRYQLHGALGDVENLVGMDEFLQEAGSHLLQVESDNHALAVFGRAMKDTVGVVVEDGNRVVALPRHMVLPGEVGGAIQVLEIVVLAAELPDDLPCFATDAHDGVHVTGGDDIIPRIRLVDTVDVEEIKGVLFRLPMPIFARRAAKYIAHPDVICGPPFEY